jgi:hypothetical protein
MYKGELFHEDIFFMGIAQKSLANIQGFLDLIEKKNSSFFKIADYAAKPLSLINLSSKLVDLLTGAQQVAEADILFLLSRICRIVLFETISLGI